MSQVYKGIFHDGVITLSEPVPLPNNTEVLVTVPQHNEVSQSEKNFLDSLRKKGLISQNLPSKTYHPKSSHKRIKIKGQPISQILLDERI